MQWTVNPYRFVALSVEKLNYRFDHSKLDNLQWLTNGKFVH